jgi:hypothetical protein
MNTDPKPWFYFSHYNTCLCHVRFRQFFFSQPDKNSDYTGYQQSWPWELLLCKVQYAGLGEGWMLVYDYMSCILPEASSSRLPNFLFACTELNRDGCWWGISGGCGGVGGGRGRTQFSCKQCCGSESGSVGSTCFVGLLDPDLDPLVKGMDPDPSIIKQK